MPDLAGDFAALVADVLAYADALRSGGTEVVARGALPGLPAAEPWPTATKAAPMPTWLDAAPRPEARPSPPAGRPAAPEPRPQPARPPEPRPPAPARAGAPRAAEPPPPADPTPAPSASGAGLFASSKWAKVLVDPARQLDELASEAGAACPDCGQPPPRGEGSARARIAVVAAPLRGEAAVMFERMLVHVLLLERADAFVLPAPPCATCRAHLARVLDVVDPRVVLAMGRAGADAARGWKGRVLATFHPDDLVARPQDKRAAMEHLQEARKRL